MFTRMRAKNFKSWKDTGEVRFAPLTAFFGRNNSGKTALLQTLLLMRQTVQAEREWDGVLRLRGEPHTTVDFGEFGDIVHGHRAEESLEFAFSWRPPQPFRIHGGPEGRPFMFIDVSRLEFQTEIRDVRSTAPVEAFSYLLEGKYKLGMRRRDGEGVEYDLISEGFEPPNTAEPHSPLPWLRRCYGFPSPAARVLTHSYGNEDFWVELLPELEGAFTGLFERLYYLGPLRVGPQRAYEWENESPRDVGAHGEHTVAVILAARAAGEPIDAPIVHWLREMDLVHDHAISRKEAGKKEHEVRLSTTEKSPTVPLTDVGLSVSQVLPVLALCYYAPRGSVLVLEQPEVHLHPAAQAVLADALIETVGSDKQIILESHSEHLLRRLQTRIAEHGLPDNKRGIASKDVALYFCRMEKGASVLEPLKLDEYGNISNWPAGFFADPLEEAMARTEAQMQHRKATAE
jgi:hypothetical protein